MVIKPLRTNLRNYYQRTAIRKMNLKGSQDFFSVLIIQVLIFLPNSQSCSSFPGSNNYTVLQGKLLVSCGECSCDLEKDACKILKTAQTFNAFVENCYAEEYDNFTYYSFWHQSRSCLDEVPRPIILHSRHQFTYEVLCRRRHCVHREIIWSFDHLSIQMHIRQAKVTPESRTKRENSCAGCPISCAHLSFELFLLKLVHI